MAGIALGATAVGAGAAGAGAAGAGAAGAGATGAAGASGAGASGAAGASGGSGGIMKMLGKGGGGGGAPSGGGGGAPEMPGGGKKGLGLKGKGGDIAKVGGIFQGIRKGILGLKQKSQANKMNPTRPTQKVNKETTENAAMYRNAVQGADPIANRATENIARGVSNQTSQAAKYATSGADVLNMLGSSQNQANQAIQDVAANSAKRKESMMGAYARANTALAGEKDKAFDYNRKERFKEDTAKKSALEMAGKKNLNTGISETIGGAAKLAGTEGAEGGTEKDSAAPGAPGAPGVGGKAGGKMPSMPTENPGAGSTKPGIKMPSKMPLKPGSTKPGI